MAAIPNLHQQLTNYIKKNIVKGYTPETLKYALISQGYSKSAIEKAMVQANQEMADTVPEMNEKPRITHKILTDKENIEIRNEKHLYK